MRSHKWERSGCGPPPDLSFRFHHQRRAIYIYSTLSVRIKKQSPSSPRILLTSNCAQIKESNGEHHRQSEGVLGGEDRARAEAGGERDRRVVQGREPRVHYAPQRGRRQEPLFPPPPHLRDLLQPQERRQVIDYSFPLFY